jgi:hypothetical protein
MTMPMRTITSRSGALAAVLLAGALLLGGCGGSGTGTQDDGLSEAIARTRASYQILDLLTGNVHPAGQIPDLLTNPLYRTTTMVFHRVHLAGTVGTASGGLGTGVDQSAAAASPDRFYLAVFETTQAQWQAIAASTPWTTLVSATAPEDVRVGDTFPAIGISLDLANAACQGYLSARNVRLAVPSDVQWEIAARAGTTSTYAWGESSAPAVVAANALVAETAGATRGAQPVGGLAPSTLGFYDLHGNVWELSAEAHLRGGSWNDPVSTARAANRAEIDQATRHLLVGVRFVYQP